MKCYFDVTNNYVLHKLRIILFPFTVKVSARLKLTKFSQDEDGWRPRQFDITAGQQETAEERDLQTPDLYIPLMSFVTFILLIGVKTGGNQE